MSRTGNSLLKGRFAALLVFLAFLSKFEGNLLNIQLFFGLHNKKLQRERERERVRERERERERESIAPRHHPSTSALIF
jgi:hypothetical protein